MYISYHLPEKVLVACLESSFVVVDGFAVVVCLDQSLTDLAGQSAVTRVLLQSRLVHLNGLLRLEKGNKPTVNLVLYNWY